MVHVIYAVHWEYAGCEAFPGLFHSILQLVLIQQSHGCICTCVRWSFILSVGLSHISGGEAFMRKLKQGKQTLC